MITFGCNDEGALGRDTSKEGSEMEPGKVILEGHVVQITAGDSHTAALLADGKVYAWGSFRVSIPLHGTFFFEELSVYWRFILLHVPGLKWDNGPLIKRNRETTHRNVARLCRCEDIIRGRPPGYVG